MGEPAVHLRRQALVGGKRKPDGGLVFQELRDFLVEFGSRQRHVHTQRRRCSLWTQADAIPNLALHIFGLAKQSAVPIGRNDQASVGLGKTGQVIKVAVVAVRKIAVAVSSTLRRGGDDGDTASAQLGGQCGAALRVNGSHGGIVGGALGLNGLFNAYGFATCARNSKPNAFMTFKMVSKLGERSPDSAL